MRLITDSRELDGLARERPSRVVRLLLAMTCPAKYEAAWGAEEFPFLTVGGKSAWRHRDATDSQIIERNLTS